MSEYGMTSEEVDELDERRSEKTGIPCRVCGEDCEGPIEDAVEYQVCFECVKGIVAC